VGQWDERTASAAGRRAGALLRRIDQFPELPIGVVAALAFHAAKRNRPASEVDRLVDRALAITAEPPPQDFANALLATLWLTESYGRAVQLCDAEFAVAQRRGDVADLAEVSTYRSWVLLRQGELADAEAHARWALERGEASVRLAASASLIEALIERDALAAADDALERCADLLGSPFITALQCLYVRGRLRSAQGRLEEALADLLKCGERCRRLELTCVSGTPWRSEAALVQHALGHGEKARRLVDEELELARAFGRPRALGAALRTRALVDDDCGGSIDGLREAVELLSHSSARLELARALTDCGTALRRRGSRSEARKQLEHALDLAHACGARAIASRARGELIALGAKPRRDAITGRDALTASELRVARLAAQGMTNREIAQALYISTKTAEVHLSHVYRKLGISSRSQLTAALAGVITAGHAAGEAAASVISRGRASKR
jgi:DNA-binding CsgD family transcriptional regulator